MFTPMKIVAKIQAYRAYRTSALEINGVMIYGKAKNL